MGGGKTTTESKTAVDPKLLELYYRNYDQANQVANTPFQPYTNERVAGLNDTQGRVKGILEQVVGNQTGKLQLDQAGDTARGILNNPIRAGQIRETDLSAYMNPYTQNVVDSSLADLSRARDVQRVADNQAATRANAFGGSRQGVADMLTNDAYLRNVASTSANLRSSAYDKAVSAASGDIDRRLSADSTNASNRMGVADRLAAFSDQELMQELRRAGALGAVGDAERNIEQSRNDAAFEEFMRMIGYPAQQQQLRNQALGMVPMQQTQTNTSKTSGGILDFLGPIASVASVVPWGKL